MYARHTTRFVVSAALAWAASLAGIAVAMAAETDSETTSGRMRVLDEHAPRGGGGDLPLRHTKVEADISGFVARTRVTQTFHNPFDRRIEAVYVYPLPDDGAVDHMRIEVGDRVILGEVKRRQDALAAYEKARSEGKLAGLLEQERPNVFTQSVANIRPGEEIKVAIELVHPLALDDGVYEYVFPMVVGPRYVPGAPLGGADSGRGFARDTDRVPDASRVTPPVLRPGERSGHDIDVEVTLDAGMPLRGVRAVNHRVDVRHDGDTRAVVTLERDDRIPNKDFVLRYRLAGEAPEVGLVAHKDERGGFFTLMVQPAAQVADDVATPKEMFFVVDTSGSMSGRPIALAKDAIRHALRHMNPRDTFQVIDFSETAASFSARPLANTSANVKKGLRFVDGMSGGGGTNMLSGILACLDTARDRERLRIVYFLTDGYIGNEAEILAATEKHLGDARLFSLGVGSSVNRYLLDRLAKVGRGAVQYVGLNEDPKGVVAKFHDRISHPYLTDIEVDYRQNDTDVSETYPSRIPDVFAGQPVVVHGRYSRGGRTRITVRGNLGGARWRKDLTLELPVKSRDESHSAQASMWARANIEDLMSQMFRGEEPALVEEVTKVALEFQLMSQYTAFVAVEQGPGADDGDGEPLPVTQPVPMPDGVSYEGVFGGGVLGGASPGPAKSGMTMGYGRGAGGVGKRMNAPAAAAPSMRPGRDERERRFESADRLSARVMRKDKGADVDAFGLAAEEPAPVGEAAPSAPSARGPADSPAHASPEILGAADHAAVARALHRSRRVIERAIEAARKAHPGAHGTLVLELVVDARGRITRVDVAHDGVGNASVVKALRDDLEDLKLPAQRGGYRVRLPLVL